MASRSSFRVHVSDRKGRYSQLYTKLENALEHYNYEVFKSEHGYKADETRTVMLVQLGKHIIFQHSNQKVSK